ncbi:MAG: TolB family protein [Thermomicrobiales bacterium]
MSHLSSTIRTRHILIASVALAGMVSVPLALMPAPVEAAVPGYNGKIAFVSTRDGNDEIYAMNADGTNQTRLTTNLATDKDPSWSPDGTRLAFTSSRDGNNEIYVMHADGSNAQRLTTSPASDNAPRWDHADVSIDARWQLRDLSHECGWIEPDSPDDRSW